MGSEISEWVISWTFECSVLILIVWTIILNINTPPFNIHRFKTNFQPIINSTNQNDPITKSFVQEQIDWWKGTFFSVVPHSSFALTMRRNASSFADETDDNIYSRSAILTWKNLLTGCAHWRCWSGVCYFIRMSAVFASFMAFWKRGHLFHAMPFLAAHIPWSQISSKFRHQLYYCPRQPEAGKRIRQH